MCMYEVPASLCASSHKRHPAVHANVVIQRPGPLRGALQHSNSSLLLELVRVLDAPGLRLEGLRRRRPRDHARLAQQPANCL